MSGRKWIKDEIDYLEEHYGEDGVQEIADELDRTKKSIYSQAHKYNLSDKEKKWTKEEKQFLRDNWSDMSGSEMANELGTTAPKVLAMGKNIGLDPKFKRENYQKWTKDEEIFMYQHYTKMDNKDIAEELKRTSHSVKRKSDRMDLSSKWEQWEDEVIFKYWDYNIDSAQELANTTLSHRTPEAIKLRAGRKFGISYFYDKVTKKCPNCDKEFDVRYSHKDSRTHCSRKCFIESDEPTDIEKIMMNALEDDNIGYEFQKEIGPYFADFVIDGTNLVVEADGDFWHKDGINKQREGYMKKERYETLHLSGSEIHNDVQSCIDKIKNTFGGV